MTPITPRLSVEELVDTLNGLIGLVQLTTHRPDLPREICSALTESHRYREALAVSARAAEAAALLQALQPATGPVEGDIAEPCNCTVHIHCPRCKGADGIYPIGDDRMSCLECSHKWAAPSSSSAPDRADVAASGSQGEGVGRQGALVPLPDAAASIPGGASIGTADALAALAGGFPADEDVDAFIQAARGQAERAGDGELRKTAEHAISFLRLCEWNDRHSEIEASDIAHALDAALSAPAAVKKPAFLVAAEHAAAEYGVSVEEVLRRDLEGVASAPAAVATPAKDCDRIGYCPKCRLVEWWDQYTICTNCHRNLLFADADAVERSTGKKRPPAPWPETRIAVRTSPAPVPSVPPAGGEARTEEATRVDTTGSYTDSRTASEKGR